MQKNDIVSYVIDGKIYHLDKEGNFYDEIVTTDDDPSLDGFFDKIKSGFKKIGGKVKNLFNRNNDKPDAEKQNVLDKIRNGTAQVAKISSNANTLLENENAPSLNPNKSGVVQSGANADEAGKVYNSAFKQAGMSFDLNNKWVMVGGGLLAASVVVALMNSNKKQPARRAAPKAARKTKRK